MGETRYRLDGEEYMPLLEGRNVWQLVYGFTEPKLWISTAAAERHLQPHAEFGGKRSNDTISVAWRDVPA